VNCPFFPPPLARILPDSLTNLVFPPGSWSISLSPLYSLPPPMTTGDVSQTHPTFPLRPSLYLHATSDKDSPLLPLLPPLLPSTCQVQVPPVANSTFSKATPTTSTRPLRSARTTPSGALPALAPPTTYGPQYNTPPHSAPRRPHLRSHITSSPQSPSPSARSRYPHQTPREPQSQCCTTPSQPRSIARTRRGWAAR
jgi:hypothetical protein